MHCRVHSKPRKTDMRGDTITTVYDDGEADACAKRISETHRSTAAAPEGSSNLNTLPT